MTISGLYKIWASLGAYRKVLIRPLNPLNKALRFYQ